MLPIIIRAGRPLYSQLFNESRNDTVTPRWRANKVLVAKKLVT
jgi:hypothetical protein